MNNNLLKDYAIAQGFDPTEFITDFKGAPIEEQEDMIGYIMQQGGSVDNTEQDQFAQIIQAFAQLQGVDPQEIVQQLQQLQPEEQQAALEQMVQVVQQAQNPEGQQSPQEEQTEQYQGEAEEQLEMQYGGDLISSLGYADNSPFRTRNKNLIKSPNITMSNVGKDLIGISDTGDIKFMPAYSGDYKFQGSNVTEIPYGQTSVNLEALLQQALNKGKPSASKKDYKQEVVDKYKQSLSSDALRFIKKLDSEEDPKKIKEYTDRIKKQINLINNVTIDNVPVPSTYYKGMPLYVDPSSIGNNSASKSNTTKVGSGLVQVNGQNQKYNLTPDYPGAVLYTDEIGNRWENNNGNFTVIGKTENSFVNAKPDLDTNKGKNGILGNNAGNKDSRNNTSRIESTTNLSPWLEAWNKDPEFAKLKTNKDRQSYVFDKYDTDKSGTIDKNEAPEGFELNSKFSGKPFFLDSIIGKNTKLFLPKTDNTFEKNDLQKISVNPLEANNVENLSTLQSQLDKRLVNKNLNIKSSQLDSKIPNPSYRFNTSNLFNELANNYKVQKAFSPLRLPYMKNVDRRAAEAPYIDPRPYQQQVTDSISGLTANINSNSTTGQSVLSGLASQLAKGLADVNNQVAQKNQQIGYQNAVNNANLYNGLIQDKENANLAYYDDLLRTEANSDALKDSAISGVATLANQKMNLANYFNEILQNNANTEDGSNFLDNLLGRKKIVFRKDLADKSLIA